eukprot:1188967-Prorocentrum_minimum.AAC.1
MEYTLGEVLRLRPIGRLVIEYTLGEVLRPRPIGRLDKEYTPGGRSAYSCEIHSKIGSVKRKKKK